MNCSCASFIDRASIWLKELSDAFDELKQWHEFNGGEPIEVTEQDESENLLKSARAYFKKRHGETVYPSDLMNYLGVEYELAEAICDELVELKRIREIRQ